ncbi:DUF4124 domain-containing protein [Pseudoalteromonas piscicida]|nr:DUF4124 domain-containing protein [Pseudoalteromonas piscicida]
MKAASYLMIMIMLVAVACLFVLKRPDGKPWLSTDAITESVEQSTAKLKQHSTNAFEQVKSHTQQLVTNEGQEVKESVKVYRWQDENGQWHYSDKPNPAGHSQAYQIDEDKITVVAAEDTSILTRKSSQEPSKTTSTALPTALNPAAVKQVMDDAKNVQKLMDERAKKIDEALKENH